MSDPKPKRVLTEAQRLAFLKGREKRMANLERKRLEKAEAQAMTEPPESTKQPDVDVPVGIDKPKPKSPEPVPVATATKIDIDYDELAKRLAVHMEPPKPTKRAYVRRKPVNPTTPPRQSYSPETPSPPRVSRPMTLWL